MIDHSRLEESLGALPTDVEPSRDLWPRIRSEIKADLQSRVATGRSRFLNGWGQVAAGVTLVVITAMSTYVVTRNSASHDMAANNFVSVNFDGRTLGPGYVRARADLERLFQERIALLPEDTRTRLQKNLVDLRRAADEIAAVLAEHPTDPLLQELLVSTRRRELQLLTDISQMQLPNS